METFLQDLRYGFRMLAKSPGFTAIAVITLALGVGMTTSIFSVVYGVLLRPLDYERPHRIVQLHEVNAQGRQMQFADPNFEDVRSQAQTLQGAAEYAYMVLSVSGGTEPTRTLVASVSRDFFPVLRVKPILGRDFAPEDQQYGTAPVALVGYGYWQEFLGGTSDLVSKKLQIDDRVFSIIGVLPPRFSFPPTAQIWVPREIYERYPSRTAHNWRVLGRLRDGASLEQARAELQTIANQLKQQYGHDTWMVSVAIAPLREAMTSDVRPALWILLSAVLFLLLIACANVANLLLVQSAARQHEMAVRSALGATRSRVVRQLVAEALLLSLAGAVLGVLAAYSGLYALLALSPNVLPRMAEVSLSMPVLVFSLFLCLVVAFVLGVFNGLRSSSGLQYGLAAGGRSQVSSLVSGRLSRAIVAGQLAITLTLLAGATLLGRSLLRVLSIDPGFRTEHIVTMELSLPDIVVLSGAAQDNKKAHRVQFLDEMFARLHRIPGVTEVGGTSNLPLSGQHPDGTYILMNTGEALPSNESALEQMFHDQSRTGYAEYAAVTDGYFRVLGIPLLRGRLFDERDTMNAPHAAIVSESLANQKWPHEDPLGHQLEFGNMDGDLRLLTVIGVVGEVRADNLEHAAFPTIYVDCRQRPQATSFFNVVMRGSGDPAAMIASARQIVRELDPNVPPKFATLDQVVSGSLQGRRFNVTLVTIFAGTALLLALAGMYGVMAYSVTRRTNEIGVRMALGADRTTIMRLVLGQGLKTGVIGAVLGIAASLATTRAITSLLFGMSAMDPITFTAVTLLLIVVALLASYFPARRASQVDPMVALRYE